MEWRRLRGKCGEKGTFVRAEEACYMNDLIQVLPDSIANQIAAGEVIQRPSSVIKELVENAIDAGARKIKIEVEEAGKAMIRVTDDGCGMSTQDARMSFERHATSKIRQAEDLFSLHTMGFRGEALASIASVCSVTLTTRRKEDELATCLQIAGGVVEQTSRCAAPVGSCFEVRNLFYNVPARRRFLKSDTTEWRHILTCYERIVAVYPEVAFSLYQNGAEASVLQAGSLSKRIASIMPKGSEKGMLPLSFRSDIVNISGFVGSPEHAKQRAAKQLFFVNGRFMRHPYFHHAVMQAYKTLIPTGYQPSYFIYFELDPARIDVNVHPTKTEIKFLDEQAVYRLLGTLIRQTLHRAVSMPRLDFNARNVLDLPAYKGAESDGSTPTPPAINADKEYNPFKETPVARTQARKSDWATVFSNFAAPERKTRLPQEVLFEQMIKDEEPTKPSSGTPLLLSDRYMAVVLQSGLAIINAKRAEMRIEYEETRRKFAEEPVGERKQRLVVPRIMDFDAREASVLEAIIPDLDSLGFEVSPLGNGSFSLLTVPFFLKEDAQTLVENGVLELLETEGNGRETLIDALARAVSIQHYASPSQPLTPTRAEQIVAALFSTPEAAYTPTGKRILHLVTNEEIEGFFA